MIPLRAQAAHFPALRGRLYGSLLVYARSSKAVKGARDNGAAMGSASRRWPCASSKSIAFLNG